MLSIKRHLRSEKGFTMIEMMVVLIIIAVLLAGGIKFYSGYIVKSKITKAKSEISTIQAALDSYYAENNTYPKSDDELKAAGIDTSIISTDSGAKYKYDTSTDGSSYTITSKDKLDGTNYVVGKGNVGNSTPPEVAREIEI